MKLWKTQIKRTALALCAAALIVPAAQASGRPDDRAVGPRSTDVQQTARPDDRAGYRGVGDVAQTSIRPDDRAGFRGIGTLAGAPTPNTAVRPDDRNGFRGVDSSPTVIVSSGGFDWTDAGVGALGAFGFSLLLAGGMLLAIHSHQRKQSDKVAVL